ncbi:fumarylacetoacetate hydrolase family protein [Variovorax sp. LjRoot175]|uniref:fumarylacetoacetate hydrolase family protein n=1 Tax=Variovorax sp. LjRoot175 TaxID=3342276 RepID=UPI003F5189C3
MEVPLSKIDAVADALIHARRTRNLADAAPLADALTDTADAYAVQQRVARELGGFEAAAPQYWKSGGPSRGAVLTHARLPPAGVWTSPAQSGTWPFHMRGIEAEVALRLARDVDATLAETLDAGSASALVDAMTVSIELVDSRWREALGAPALFKLADLQSHGALVLGPWIPFAARDWRAQTCRVQIGAQPAVERRGTHSLGDPAFLLTAWLRHATLDGRSLPAGTVVTTGTWVGILHAAAGDLVTAEFPGIGRASVQL